jgi:hypothetical protein
MTSSAPESIERVVQRLQRVRVPDVAASIDSFGRKRTQRGLEASGRSCPGSVVVRQPVAER